MKRRSMTKNAQLIKDFYEQRGAAILVFRHNKLVDDRPAHQFSGIATGKHRCKGVYEEVDRLAALVVVRRCAWQVERIRT